MSGHSKWSTIKRQKGVKDQKRGQLFSKLARAIRLAAKEGLDPEMNFKLRLAIDKAKEANMPKENIDRAIKRVQGGAKGGGGLEEITFEGYGPGGVAVMVQAATDNRQRTAAEVKRVLEKAGGSLGEKGCVAYLFQPRGVVTVKTKDQDLEEVMLGLIDWGVEDVGRAGEAIIAYTSPEKLGEVKDRVVNQGLVVENATINLEPKTAKKAKTTSKDTSSLAANVFLKEKGKTKTVALIKPAEPQVLSALSVGENLTLDPKKKSLQVKKGKLYLGSLPNLLAFRLQKLLKRGYRYQVYFWRTESKTVSVFIKEVFRPKKMAGIPSFI